MVRRAPVPVVAGSRRFSVVYGPDLARHIVDLALHPRAAGRILFAAEPRAYAFREIVEAVGRAMECRARILPLPAVAARLLASCGSLAGRFRRRPPFLTLAKLPEVLAPGWACDSQEIEGLLDAPSWTILEEGCRLTAAWYRERGWI
jgi:nucleoside-diphosphate-sugar epimerase